MRWGVILGLLSQAAQFGFRLKVRFSQVTKSLLSSYHLDSQLDQSNAVEVIANDRFELCSIFLQARTVESCVCATAVGHSCTTARFPGLECSSAVPSLGPGNRNGCQGRDGPGRNRYAH